MRHLTDFDQTVDFGEVTAQIPQLYFEKFTEHRLESLVEPSETEEETVLLLRTSFPPFVRLESTQVMATKPADGRRAFYGCDHCRDISFYDEYVFPVTAVNEWDSREISTQRRSRKQSAKPKEHRAKPESIISVKRERC